MRSSSIIIRQINEHERESHVLRQVDRMLTTLNSLVEDGYEKIAKANDTKNKPRKEKKNDQKELKAATEGLHKNMTTILRMINDTWFNHDPGQKSVKMMRAFAEEIKDEIKFRKPDAIEAFRKHALSIDEDRIYLAPVDGEVLEKITNTSERFSKMLEKRGNEIADNIIELEKDLLRQTAQELSKKGVNPIEVLAPGQSAIRDNAEEMTAEQENDEPEELDMKELLTNQMNQKKSPVAKS